MFLQVGWGGKWQGYKRYDPKLICFFCFLGVVEV